MEEWIKENYEKAALGAAGVVAVAVGAIILFGGGGDSGKKDRAPEVNNSTEISSFVELSQTLKDRKSKVAITGGDLDVFIGKDLYARKGSTDPVDLEVSADVHPGIKNSIFIDNPELDPSFENSPKLDVDGDGFSLLEEVKASTDPTKADSHPDPLEKLLVTKVDAFVYRLRWSEFAKPQITLRYLDINGGQTAEQAKPGDVLFKEGPMKGRFQLSERQKLNDPNGREQDAYVLTDLSDFKKGKQLKVYRRGLTEGTNQFSDFSATLELGALGQKGKVFTLQEGEAFSLPYDKAATKKPYKLKSIESDGANYTLLFESTEGDKKSHKLNIAAK